MILPRLAPVLGVLAVIGVAWARAPGGSPAPAPLATLVPPAPEALPEAQGLRAPQVGEIGRPAKSAGATESRLEPPAPEAPDGTGTLPVSVSIVDAETGHPLRGGSVGVDGSRKEVDVVPTADTGDPSRFEVPVPTPDDREWTLRVFVDPPGGFDDQPMYRLRWPVVRRATRLSAVVPVRRLARLECVVAEPGGGRLADPTAVSVLGGGGPRETTLPAGHSGRVEGVQKPFYRGEWLTVTAVAAGPRGTRSAATALRMPYDAHESATAVLVLPSEPPAVTSFSGRGGSRTLRCGSSGFVGRPPEGPRGTVIVRWTRRGGLSAEGVRAQLRQEGAAGRSRPFVFGRDGTARVEGVVPGLVRFAVREPGVLPCGGTAEVCAGETVTLEVAEPEGGEVLVVVVDAEGRPLPFADLRVQTPSGVPWTEVDAEGVQRIDGWTDEMGRRLLGAVESGDVGVEARYGARVAKATARVEHGRRSVVRIVLE